MSYNRLSAVVFIDVRIIDPGNYHHSPEKHGHALAYRMNGELSSAAMRTIPACHASIVMLEHFPMDRER
jgi:hypothetical protein